jgi:hypothetical protein
VKGCLSRRGEEENPNSNIKSQKHKSKLKYKNYALKIVVKGQS